MSPERLCASASLGLAEDSQACLLGAVVSGQPLALHTLYVRVARMDTSVLQVNNKGVEIQKTNSILRLYAWRAGTSVSWGWGLPSFTQSCLAAAGKTRSSETGCILVGAKGLSCGQETNPLEGRWSLLHVLWGRWLLSQASVKAAIGDDDDGVAVDCSRRT